MIEEIEEAQRIDARRERIEDVEEWVGIGAGVARLAAAAGLRMAWWGAEAYVRGARRLAQAAIQGESPSQLLDELADEARRALRLFLDEDEPRSEPLALAPPPALEMDSATELRRLGAELLARSADVNGAGGGHAHPAYLRIVSELAPDEARILRLLCTQGPQPSVDVRMSKVPLMTSELVAPGLNMIGRQAGVAYLDRAPAYLNNLERLGLIWFSREPLPDPLDYQVLEAQPEVVEALHRGRGKTVRRSIHLTPFGDDFCSVVLPPDPDVLDVGVVAEDL